MTMKQHASRPRVFGRQLAREMTREEVDLVSGAHGESGGGSTSTGFTTADLCADGSLTGPQCGDYSTQNDIGGGGGF